METHLFDSVLLTVVLTFLGVMVNLAFAIKGHPLTDSSATVNRDNLQQYMVNFNTMDQGYIIILSGDSLS